MATPAATIINGFNVGSDVSFVLQDQFGDVLSAAMLGHLTEFDSESEDVPVKITPITTGGIPIFQTIWNGVRGHMRYTRVNGVFQQTFSDLMAAYYAVGVIPQMTLQAKVRNRDASVDSYIFLGLQMTRPRFGNFVSTREVDMRVEFRASTMVSLTGAGATLTALALAA